MPKPISSGNSETRLSLPSVGKPGAEKGPYRLAQDIRGIGFKTADAIAMKLGVEKTAMIRLRAGISFALTEAMDEGHCGLPTDQLIPLAKELLEAPKELILTAWSSSDPKGV